MIKADEFRKFGLTIAADLNFVVYSIVYFVLTRLSSSLYVLCIASFSSFLALSLTLSLALFLALSLTLSLVLSLIYLLSGFRSCLSVVDLLVFSLHILSLDKQSYVELVAN